MADNFVNPFPGAALPSGFDLDALSKIAKPGLTPDGIGGGSGGVGASGTTVDIDVTIPNDPNLVPVFLDPAQIISLLNSFKPWKRQIKMLPFTVGIVPVTLLPVDDTRTYFMIVNTGGANTIFVGFDVLPNAGNSLPLFINGGSYEPLIVPSNAVSVVGAGAGSTGILLYAN